MKKYMKVKSCKFDVNSLYVWSMYEAMDDMNDIIDNIVYQ